MTERLQLPLRPTGASLAAYVAHLDLVAARLDLLPSRAHWPARIPINSKASFDGDIVHTNQLKVHIGGEWWVEMTASEAAAFVRRRKAVLLDEQARLVEGRPRTDDVTDIAPTEDVDMAPAPPSHHQLQQVRFDPLFANPVRVGSPSGDAASGTVAVKASGSTASSTSSTATSSRDAAPGASQSGTASEQEMPSDLQALVNLMGDKLSLPKENGGNETVNEDGLPIHEIRETLDGNTIGSAPEPSGEGVVSVDERDADYWTPEAVARREALRRRVFNEDSSDESDPDNGMDVDEPLAASSTLAPPKPASPPPAPQPATQPSPQPSPQQTLAPPGSRSPNNPPKSILKVPHRKKSVTFDPSTRLPPDSPPARSPVGKLAFPFGNVVTEGSGKKSVPILAPPTPGRKTAPAATFGGFKRGFLTGPGAQPPPVPPQEPKIEEINDDDVDMDQPKKKKQSLFAQRRAENSPNLPRLADAKPMAAMKTDIVEKPSSLADRIQTPATTKAPQLPSVPRTPTVPPAVGAVSDTNQTPVVVVDHDEDSSDYGDLGDFSDDEEDEYALDEALLQREVALAYHRRQGWQRPVDEDEIDPEAEAEDGGVLMGVPRVSTVTGGEEDPLRIVNPTADDLSQFLRVGRGDDGELVFERPIVDSGSESDGEGGDRSEETDAQKADRRARRARRKDVMDRLLRGEYEDENVADSPAVQRAAWERSLPPSVGANPNALAPINPPPAAAAAPTPRSRRVETGPVVERSSAPAPAPAAEPAAASSEEAPKRVSRFKAARQQS